MQLTKSSTNLSFEKLDVELQLPIFSKQWAAGHKHPGKGKKYSPGRANKRCSLTGYEPKLLIFCKIFCDPKNNLRSNKPFSNF